MSKFKVGDDVVFKNPLYESVDFVVGSKFKVLRVYEDDTVKLEPYDKSVNARGVYTVDQFELDTEYLTPEQVLQYFKEGRQDELECTSEVTTTGWVKLCKGEILGICKLFERTWRVEPKPKTVDFYGVELPKNITKEEAKSEGLEYVYREGTCVDQVIPVDVGFMSRDFLYFRTEADAQLVLDTIRKPFKA